MNRSVVAGSSFFLILLSSPVLAANSSPQDILKQALLGAGSGALSAELSGGKAGTGALVGAGTNVIGGALLGALFDSPGASQSAGYHSAPPMVYASAPAYNYSNPPRYVYTQPREVYVQPVAYATAAPVMDSNRQIIRNGLMGAGVGAISAEVSGGKAGTGALVGAGTNVIGGALLDTLLGGPSSQPQAAYHPMPVYGAPSGMPAGQKKIVRHFDQNGNLVSEEEFYV